MIKVSLIILVACTVVTALMLGPTPEVLVMAISGVLCGLLGYFFGWIDFRKRGV